MTDDTQIYRMLGELTAKVDRLIKDQEEAAKRRELMASDVASLRGEIEDIHPKLEKSVKAADELDGIKKMGRGYLAGVFAAGIGGGSMLVYFKDHISSLSSLFKS